MKTIEITLKLNTADLVDLMTSVVESGYLNYWVDGVRHVRGDAKSAPWYADTRFYEDDSMAFMVTYQTLRGEPKTKYIYKATLVKGLEKMAVNCPQRFSEILSDSQDAATADCFLQCVIFGEVVYG